jgi:DNA polymerase-3 subunit gamma/tau
VPPAPVAVPAPALDAAPAPAAAQAPSAPEAAWPTAAVPGASGEPEPVVPPAPAPAAEPSGGLDATAVRRSWDAVLAAVRPRKRTTEALLLNAQVLDVAGRTVTLGFNTAPLMRNFQQGTNVDVLKEALQEVLGLDAVIELTTTAAGPAAPAAPAPVTAAPRPEPAAVPTYEGLAPGDEIEPEDPDNPKGERIAGGEDAAIALLKDQLGGTVVDGG